MYKNMTHAQCVEHCQFTIGGMGGAGGRGEGCRGEREGEWGEEQHREGRR